MLEYRVDIRRLSHGFVPTAFNKTSHGVATPEKLAPATPASTPALAGDSVSVSQLPTFLAEPTLTSSVAPPPTPSATPTVRFKSPQSTSGNSAYATGPLLMGMDAEPVYMDEIRVLDSRYPGVADKLKNFEVEAAENGYCPVSSKSLEASVLADPPWPTTSFGSARENISNKAKELQEQSPALASKDPSSYDFKKANEASSDLMETLDTMFPKDKYPELAMGTRAKAPASLAKKMEKQVECSDDFSMAHLTDTVGARIDAPDLKQMGEVAKALETQYEGKIVAKSDYISQPGENGYRAIHYIIDIGGRMAEIQTSTSNLRAADLATHDTVYKPEFPVSPETAKELSTAADRIMFLECLTAKGMR